MTQQAVKDPPAMQETACNARDHLQCRRCWFNPWVGKMPSTRKWQPTPIFLPGKSHSRGAWCSAVHSVTKELDLTYWLNHHQILVEFIIWFQGRLSRIYPSKIQPSNIWSLCAVVWSACWLVAPCFPSTSLFFFFKVITLGVITADTWHIGQAVQLYLIISPSQRWK